MWRGGLPPLGCEAAPKPDNALFQQDYGEWFWDCFAAQRGQAPSPQKSPLLDGPCCHSYTRTNKNAAILSRRFCV
ncbi:hypothetical protein PS645_00789 [Pseudomonas fluorescens]|uniref:Uncharacterized protein n=1 Tax=Pseudomonas fluorescens TaxID=294 RepID=A0A5E6Q745_PSEFL|nr:hypothetical protein PS645_00789 [Pseudomonas fluorescens]